MRLFIATVIAIIAILAPVASALAVTSTTVTFQNGANGYNDTFEHKIGENSGDSVDGSTVQAYYMDGYNATNGSPDEQDLVRFDNIIGSNAGQIPSGAFILGAQLQYTTGQASAAQSNGPWGVAGLNQAFDSNTEYFADFPCSNCNMLGSRGAWWQDGAVDPIGHPYSTRPSGGIGGKLAGDPASFNVRPLVQKWSDGQTNYGMAVESGFTGTSDGWQVQTIGANNASIRPQLSVTYTTDQIAVNTFQHDLNGYSADTSAWVRSGTILTADGTNPDPTVDDITYDGLTGQFTASPTTTQTPGPTDFQEFLDGPNGTDSPDDVGLFKFSNVFGNGAGQAPPDKPVAKAWLVLTTGDASANARSPGKWSAYAMQRDWDPTTLYSNIGATPGLQQADGDISAEISSQTGMITGSEVWFDVTSYLEAVRNGATDYGLAVASAGTTDGWQIFFPGWADDPTVRPRLMVASDLAEVAPGLPGDYNSDGVVDGSDYVLWRKAPANFGGSPDGYNTWRSNFGRTSASGTSLSGTAVPEPATWLLGFIACAATAAVRSHKS